jgi:hypothetical protein
MSAFVELVLPSGQVCTVGPGAIVGGSFAAEVHLEDGRVSEAHAFDQPAWSSCSSPLRGRVRVAWA